MEASEIESVGAYLALAFRAANCRGPSRECERERELERAASRKSQDIRTNARATFAI